MSYYTIIMNRGGKQEAKLKIKDLPRSTRPREKLLASGRDNLSEMELIAILLGTGSAKQNVLKLSAHLLKRFSLTRLANVSFEELLRFPGIGRAKASRIVAAIELGNRIFAPSSLAKVVIRSAKDALSHVRDILDKKQEYLVVFYLNARDELIKREVVGQGSLNQMMITPKEIFGHALATPCASILVAHNHPSGDITPSDDDIGFTKRIHEAGLVLGIPMLDHLIISKSGYFSFRENKRG